MQNNRLWIKIFDLISAHTSSQEEATALTDKIWKVLPYAIRRRT